MCSKKGDVMTASGAEPRSQLQGFYSGATVFVTGATGFLGKVLLEKLLWACPDVKRVFLLVRSKRGKSVQERVLDMTSSSCFSRLVAERPGFPDKLQAVEGDISLDDLGISEQDRHLLAAEVTVVFHLAATVRFTEPLGSAIKLNVRATRDLLLLCRTFTQLKSVVHVSSVFAHCPSHDIGEKFYEPPIECDAVIKMAECLSVDMMDAITPKVLGDWPNSYTFTKAVGEEVVRKYGRGLPLAVFRPSVVLWTLAEPSPGWVDNYSGGAGVAADIYLGLFHTMHVDGSKKGDMVPCDIVVNAILAAGWDTAHKWSPTSDPPIYNCVTSRQCVNEITWASFLRHVLQQTLDKPSTRAAGFPFLLLTNRRWLAAILVFWLHLLPALIGDALLLLAGHAPWMFRKHKMMNKFTEQLGEYFGQREWNYEERNLTDLWNRLDEKDQVLFPFSMRTFDWDTFFQNTFLGFRMHLMKEGPESLPAARIRLNRLRWLLLATACAASCLLAVTSSACVRGAHALLARDT